MKPFDYNAYLKNNPLLKESIDEASDITTIEDITATLASDSTKKITIPKGSKVKVLIKRMPKEPKITQLQFDGQKVNVNAQPFINQYLSEKVNEAQTQKDLEIPIDSAEEITLKGKPLDSDKLGTDKKYTDIILKAPDKAFMYKGKPASITAVDLNDGFTDEPKIYLTIH